MFRIIRASLFAAPCASPAALIVLFTSASRKGRYQIAAKPAAALTSDADH